MKNSYYAGKYFLLKKLLKKSGSISGLLEIIRNAPAEPKDFEKYILENL